MNAPAVLTLTAAGLLLYASSSAGRGYVEAGEGDYLGAFSFDTLADTAETFANVLTETPAEVPQDMASSNLNAFLSLLKYSEGSAVAVNPYAVVFGYGKEITDFRDHPAITGEWRGERLPDAMCRNAGFSPGCISTAAGAYQIIRPTWTTLRNRLGLPDFSPASQDRAAASLIESRGALQDVYAGRIESAVRKCRNEWASLPGNSAKQGQRSMVDLLAAYQLNGGNFA